MTRRGFLRCALAFGAGGLVSRAAHASPREGDAVGAGLRFLASRQSSDGAWRSSHYGAFRNGDALTPLVLWAIMETHGAETASLQSGRKWLTALTDAQSADSGLSYPLFTASYAAQIFAAGGDVKRTAVWADVVERLQTSPELGWNPDDPACGAWGDASVPPQLPAGAPGTPDMLAPNISATSLGVQALVAAGRGERARAALPFVADCQNFDRQAGEHFDDGGFFFAAADSIRNKAGALGRDARGRERFRSYASATCDGLAALFACGEDGESPRVQAALTWLQQSAAESRGENAWPADRRDEREGLRYYTAQGLSTLLQTLAPASAHAAWVGKQKRLLRAELLRNQRRDGSWAGTSPNSFEDDPLIATAFALRALARIS